MVIKQCPTCGTPTESDQFTDKHAIDLILRRAERSEDVYTFFCNRCYKFFDTRTIFDKVAIYAVAGTYVALNIFAHILEKYCHSSGMARFLKKHNMVAFD